MKESKTGLKYYRNIIKEKGIRGFVREVGWKIAFLVFMFFFLKGMVWLFIFYGGFELIRGVFS